MNPENLDDFEPLLGETIRQTTTPITFNGTLEVLYQRRQLVNANDRS